MMRIKNRFRNFEVNSDLFLRIGLVFGIIAGVIACIAVFFSTDITPATMQDYENLEKQALLVENNPEELFKMDCIIVIEDGSINVYFENDECEIYVEYNKDFQITSLTREDKKFSFGWMVLGAVIFGMLIFIVGDLIFAILSFLLYKLIKRISNLKVIRSQC